MKKIINILLAVIVTSAMAISCKKHDESASRLVKFAKEINAAPDKELSNGTILTGCEYAIGDTLFTYVIKVPDNRFDTLETDSIKRSFSKNIKSEGMTKIVNLLNKAKVGLRYRLELDEKEVSIEFPASELSDMSKNDPAQ